MKQFAVVGNPIKHSKSPIIHQEFAKQFAIELEYKKILAPVDQFSSFINQFFADGGYGLNVTLPFKEQAFSLAQVVAPRAQLAKAANTLYMQDGKLVADNTDGAGLVRDLLFHNEEIKNKRVLLLGAGGAARGALPALLAEQPAQITLANRTKQKAQAVVSDLGSVKVIACDLSEVAGSHELIINSTSSSVSGGIPALDTDCLKNTEFAYDMFYSQDKTSFNSWVEQHSQAKTCDGLGMLVEQAAESFSIWHQQVPNTKDVRELLRQL